MHPIPSVTVSTSLRPDARPGTEPEQAEQESAALILQRSLLPSTPHVRGLDVAGRYIPASGSLGGDWYDLFRLPNGRVGIVMGDVVGHGLHAAVVMGRLRSALRAYALDSLDPAEVLRRLDRKMHYFELGAFATVLFAIAETPFARLHVSSAGHLPPLVRAGGTVQQIDLPHDLMLGVDPTARRCTTVIDLPVGGAICLFTDGLVERRPAVLDGDTDLIAEGIRLAAAAFTGRTADEVCDSIVAASPAVVDGCDDVALLVVRRTPLEPAPD